MFSSTLTWLFVRVDLRKLFAVKLSNLTLEISLLFTEFTKSVRNEILRVHCTIQNTVIPSTNLLAGLNLNVLVNTKEYFRLSDFWVTLYFPSPDSQLPKKCINFILRSIRLICT
jgi:hypothetical protein